ncbi:class I SAM-dependent methyltransferase [Prochlorococcus marinus]|uniref:class I SAM-dependent methyltransferase n=1 Tax=Prochlorococcus marinus TaxID=1219 RepID=UPI0022B30222|nr:class I SAM-dependent methyltransferase [Prochlorococcus marinus]
MQRVTEPELMQDLFQVQAYAENDFSEVNEKFLGAVEKCINKFRKTLDSSVLMIDLGCGPGQISEKIACRWPKANVIGVDDSQEMLNFARRRKNLNPKASLLEGLSYRKVNISSIAKGTNGLLKCADVVVSNSLIHHIHDPKIFWDCLMNISKKGSIHFHRDLRRPDSYQEAISLQKKYMPDAPAILSRDFLASLKAAFTVNEIKSQLYLYKFKNFDVIEVDDRYLDIIGFL